MSGRKVKRCARQRKVEKVWLEKLKKNMPETNFSKCLDTELLKSFHKTDLIISLFCFKIPIKEVFVCLVGFFVFFCFVLFCFVFRRKAQVLCMADKALQSLASGCFHRCCSFSLSHTSLNIFFPQQVATSQLSFGWSLCFFKLLFEDAILEIHLYVCVCMCIHNLLYGPDNVKCTSSL